jgi:Protein of unknown function (DUF4446)
MRRQCGACPMNDVTTSLGVGLSNAAILLIIALCAACSIAVTAIYHWAVARPRLRSSGDTVSQTGPENSNESLEALRDRVTALEAVSEDALQHVGFVRFNAFPGVGSELSFALAAIDGRGDGFLISSIYSREEVRTYAKTVRGFAADKDVSAEERRALEIAVAASKQKRG